MRATALVSVVLVATSLLTACSSDDTDRSNPPTSEAGSESAPHTHKGLPAGDGTQQSYVGYSLDGLTLPDTAGAPGTYSFRIDTYRGTPQAEFVEDQTKKMHVYVVRDDLSVFRHVHPTMASDGTWSGNLTLPTAGRYRFVAEFIAVDEGGDGDQLILGDWRDVGGATTDPQVIPAAAKTAADGDLDIKIERAPKAGTSDQTKPTLTIEIRKDGKAAELGTYLGVYAHVTGFSTTTGSVVHTHPLSAPETEDGWTKLSFHAEFPAPGDYRMFVQVRSSGLVRTVPITLTVV